jgi:hypothetical protein
MAFVWFGSAAPCPDPASDRDFFPIMQPYIPGSVHAFAGAKRHPISYHFFVLQGGEPLATMIAGKRV